jgi:hypothetical protein
MRGLETPWVSSAFEKLSRVRWSRTWKSRIPFCTSFLSLPRIWRCGRTSVGAHGQRFGAQKFRRRSVVWALCQLRSIPASVFPGLRTSARCSHQFQPASSKCDSFLDTNSSIYRLLQHENLMHSRRDLPRPDFQRIKTHSKQFIILVWHSSNPRPMSVCGMLFPTVRHRRVFTVLISSSYTSFRTMPFAASGAAA